MSFTEEEIRRLEDIARGKPAGSERKANGHAGGQPGLFTARSLNRMRFQPLKFVVPGFIAEGLTLFAGKPKIGKSWLLLHVAWAVACGDYTLGGVSCEAGDVLYASLEDNQRRLQDRLTKLFGAAVDWPSNLHFTCDMPRLADGGLKFIEDWIASVDCLRLIIIDTHARDGSRAQS
jgi:predicted ATP-dependent serine protease